MALLTWNNILTVNINRFDQEHKKLIDLINKLHEAMKVGKGKDVLAGVLKSLIDYTAQHFASEEALMRLHKYPDYESHKKEHNKLVTEVLDLQKQLNEGKAVLTQAVMEFLCQWVQKHIKDSDKRYGPFLTGKGVV